MSLEAISPNQFTFPGMEHLGHRLARHVAAGVHFQFGSSVQNVAKADTPDTLSGHSAPAYRPPLSVNPLVTEHTLSAHEGHEDIGSISWHGDSESRIHDPGEVTWVERQQANPPVAKVLAASGRPVPERRHLGIMGDLFHAGHEIGLGQRTLPIHSTDRTDFGQAWARKVGPPELVPRKGGKPIETPPGFHPFERAGSPRQMVPVMEGQGALLDLGAGRKSGFQGGGRNRSTTPVDRPHRAVAVATFHNGVRVR